MFQDPVAANSTSSKGGLTARILDASEFEPQVVELPPEEETESGDGEAGGGDDEDAEAGGKDIPDGKTESAEEAKSADVYAGLSEEERVALWMKKLLTMRESYLASMTEQERETFLKRLEV